MYCEVFSAVSAVLCWPVIPVKEFPVKGFLSLLTDKDLNWRHPTFRQSGTHHCRTPVCLESGERGCASKALHWWWSWWHWIVTCLWHIECVYNVVMCCVHYNVFDGMFNLTQPCVQCTVHLKLHLCISIVALHWVGLVLGWVTISATNVGSSGRLFLVFSPCSRSSTGWGPCYSNGSRCCQCLMRFWALERLCLFYFIKKLITGYSQSVILLCHLVTLTAQSQDQ